jgi:site-specific DNA-methyltransferase (adenine-specific)
MDSAAEWTQVGKLTPWDKNPRKNDGAIKEVARSIITLGWGAPIVAWQGRVVAGHTRLKAADLIARKWKRAKDKDDWHPDAVRVATTAEVPVRHRDDLTEEQADLLALADNKLGEIADWDEELLAEVLAKFSAEEREIAGWTDTGETTVDEAQIEAVDVSDASPTFWISVRGPLVVQPDVIDELVRTLGEVKGVEILHGMVGQWGK